MANLLSTYPQPTAAIAVNKNLLKEYKDILGCQCSRAVYLHDGDEFQIYLYNPLTVTIGASILINGQPIGNKVVIRPGEKIWLERYLDRPSKFKFSTYEVDDTSEVRNAIQDNGMVSVHFYSEDVSYENPVYDYTIHSTYPSIPIWVNKPYYPHNIYDDITWGGYSDSTAISAMDGALNANVNVNANYNITNAQASIETGRIEHGSRSSQDLDTVDMMFNDFSVWSADIKILPYSMKPVGKKDLQKVYCTECGKKLNPKFKYCPTCGHKVE